MPKAPAHLQQDEAVEEGKNLGRGLVDGAQDGAAPRVRQLAQQVAQGQRGDCRRRGVGGEWGQQQAGRHGGGLQVPGAEAGRLGWTACFTSNKLYFTEAAGFPLPL
jgi:hypothetical protein